MQYVFNPNTSEGSCVVLQLTDDEYSTIFAEQPKANIERILTFPIRGIFKDFPNPNKDPSPKELVMWNKTFHIVNKFFHTSTITDEERSDYVRMITHMSMVTRRYMSDHEHIYRNLLQLISELADLLEDFDRKYNLAVQLKDFLMYGDIKINYYENAGERPQDTPDMTFSYTEIIQVTAIAMLSKILMSITILFLNMYKDNKATLDDKIKEICFLGVFKPVLARSYFDVYNKLEHFVERIAKNGDKKRELSNTYIGFSDSIRHHHTLATIIVKRYASFDIAGIDGNDGRILIYTASCITTAKSDTRHQAAGLMLPKDETEGSSDDSNNSNLEVEARLSSKPADYVMLVNSFALCSINTYIQQHDLDVELYNNIVSYYSYMQPIDVNSWTSYVLSLEFAEYLHGASSFALLTERMINQLVPLFQLKMLKEGNIDFMHLATVSETSVEKTPQQILADDRYIQDFWKESVSYRNLNDRYNFSIGIMDKSCKSKSIRWDTSLAKIVDNLTKCKVVYNTAPALWEAIQQPVNKGVYQAPREMVDMTCRYLLRRLDEYATAS